MNLKFPPEISQENTMAELTKSNTEEEELLLFASRILQICSDLCYQPESIDVIEKQTKILMEIESSENAVNGREYHASGDHYIEQAGPSARAQGSAPTPESVHDVVDDDIAVIAGSKEPNVSEDTYDSNVVEFADLDRLLSETPHNSLDALEQEYKNRIGELQNLQPQILSAIRTYTIDTKSESERKQMDARMDATLTFGLDQSMASQQLEHNAKANADAVSPVFIPQERHGSQSSTHVKAETESPNHPRKHVQSPRPMGLFAESGEESHDRVVTIDSFETGVSNSPDPTKHRARNLNSRYTCTYCGKHQSFNSRLVEHLRIHTGEKPFPCDICERRFSRTANLRAHIRTHTGAKPFPCTLCDKRFSYSSDLSTHIRAHKGEKPFLCNICNKRFSQSATLSVHIRTHTGEKPFPCNICDRRFSRTTNLRTHIRTHTGEKPFPCSMCDKRFSQSTNVSVHIRTHTGEKPYRCTVCQRSYSSKSNLVVHTRTHT